MIVVAFVDSKFLQIGSATTIFPRGRCESSPGWSAAQAWDRMPAMFLRPGGPHRTSSPGLNHVHAIVQQTDQTRTPASNVHWLIEPPPAKTECDQALPCSRQDAENAAMFSISTPGRSCLNERW